MNFKNAFAHLHICTFAYISMILFYILQTLRWPVFSA